MQYRRLWIDNKQRMVLIIHCLLYNLNFNHCQQTTAKSICWLINSIIQIYWHDDVQHKYCWISTSQTNKSCQHYYFDVMTNFKRQDKYYWIYTFRDNKSCRIVVASWPTLNIKRKKSWSPSSPQHIPNRGFLFSLKSSSLIMDWFGKQSIFTTVSFQGIQLNHSQKILARK